jgi:hypothetical protein
MPRKRKRKRKRSPSFVFYNYSATVIQRRWRGTKTCVLTHTYLLADNRIVLDGYMFSRRALAAHIMNTGDLRHPVLQTTLGVESLHELGISKSVAVRRRRIFLREVEERESIHKMTFDEFVEMFHADTPFDFSQFILYVRGYARILERHREESKTFFLALYDEIHNYIGSIGTYPSPNGEIYDKIVRAILTSSTA